MKDRQPMSGGAPAILRREDSLSSRQYRGICVKVIYECDAVQIVRTDMDSATVLDDREIANFAVLHVVLSGSPVFHTANDTHALMPGDSIALREARQCSVSNPTSSRSSIVSFLFRGSSSRASASARVRCAVH